MNRGTLHEVLTPRADAAQALRWEVVVPIATNPFILVELFQFAFVGAVVTVLLICSGVWFTEGFMLPAQLVAALGIGGMVLGGALVGFAALAGIFFGNRYYAVYRLEAEGIYYEGSRGRDEGGELLSLHCKPYPVQGGITAARTHSRLVLWEKADRFQAIASMRTIILRRKGWHILKLYMPDPETYARVKACLAERLPEV